MLSAENTALCMCMTSIDGDMRKVLDYILPVNNSLTFIAGVGSTDTTLFKDIIMQYVIITLL